MSRFNRFACLAAASVVVASDANAQTIPSPTMLVEIGDISNPVISPDGGRVAFRVERASIERNSYTSGWYVASLRTQTGAVSVGDGGEPLRDSSGYSIGDTPQWSPDSIWIYYRALLNGEVQVWRAAADGSRVEQVTSDEADVDAFQLSRDGRRLLYSVGATRREISAAEEKEYDAGILIDGTVPVGQNVFRSAYVNGRLATQRYTGNWMARAGLLHSAPRHLRVVELDSGTVNDGAPADLASFADERGTADPSSDRLLATTTLSGSMTAYVSGAGSERRLHVRGRSSDISCDVDACRSGTIESIAWRESTGEVVFSVTVRDSGYAQSLYAWNPVENDVRLIVASDGLLSGNRTPNRSSCSISSHFAACVTASAGQPPRVEAIDLNSGVRTVLFDPNRSLAEVDTVETRSLAWSDSEGNRFTGQLFLPANSKSDERLPIFITYYVCQGYLRGGVGDEWPLASLAASGIASMCVNKGPAVAGERTGNFALAASGIRAIVGQLDEQGIVDPQRIGMGGLSFGSEVVLWIVENTNLLTAASVTSTAVTPTYYWFHALQPDFSDHLQRGWQLAAPYETPDRWAEFVPTRINAPLLMQMPEQEYLQTMEYYSQLVSTGYPAEMFVFPHEPHVKIQPRHKLAAYERNLD